MENFFKLKQELAGMFEKSAQLAENYNYNTSAETIRGIRKAFTEKKLMIVNSGEMKRGKSSLLNALLNESEPVFPVDASVCTNVVTIVKYGEEEKIEVLINKKRPDGVFRPTAQQITRKEIADYVSENGNPANFKNVSVVSIESPISLLKNGLVFVDTPGVGSLNINHATTTYGFLPKADLLLYVCDSSAPLTETELDFLEKGYQNCKNVVFVQTKKDLNSHYNTILEDNRKKISSVLNISADEVDIIPVSSTAKQRYLKTGNLQMLTNSNFEELENKLWSIIAKKRAEILLVPYINEVRNELWKIADSLKVQFAAMAQGNDKINPLIDNLNEQIEEYNKLNAKNAKWKNTLTESFQLLQNANTELMNKANADAVDILEKRVAELGFKIVKEKYYTKVYEEINDALSRGLTEVQRNMNRNTVELIEKVNDELALGLSISEMAGNQSFDAEDNVKIDLPKRKRGDKLIAGGRKVNMDMMGASRVGILIGGAIGLAVTAAACVVAGPAVAVVTAEAGSTVLGAIFGGITIGGAAGGAIGTFSGGAKGLLNAIKSKDDVDVPVVKNALLKHIKNSTAAINKIIGDEFIKVRNSVIFGFEESLKAKVSEIKETIANIKSDIQSIKNNTEDLNGLKLRINSFSDHINSYDKIADSMAAVPFDECKQPISSTEQLHSNADGDATSSYSFL